MEIVQYTPDLLTPLTQFYNRAIVDVPHCYPVKEKELANALCGMKDQSDIRPNSLDSENVFVTMQNGVVHAFTHVGLCRIGPKANREDAGLIRFMGYERGARHAGQVVLEKAEEYLKAYDINRICAFRSGYEYRFYHLEYANLSNALDHVQALLGFNGYRPLPDWVFLDWKNYVITPMPSPIQVKHSVNWVQGRGQLPDCTVQVYQENELVGGCCSVSGAEYSSHPDAQNWLHTLWIDIEGKFQGKGLGKYLLQYTLQEMHKVGYRHAQISTSWDDYRALLFYSNFGYRVVDRTYAYEKTL